MRRLVFSKIQLWPRGVSEHAHQKLHLRIQDRNVAAVQVVPVKAFLSTLSISRVVKLRRNSESPSRTGVVSVTDELPRVLRPVCMWTNDT